MKVLEKVLLCLLLGMTSSFVRAATFIDVTPGPGNATVIEVVLTTINGIESRTTESPPHGVGPPPISGSTPVLVNSIRINDGAQVGLNLAFFNTSGAAVVNVGSHVTAAGGIGVYKNGALTRSNSNALTYANAVAGTATDTDLRNFNFYDSVTVPSSPSPDMDLLFLMAVEMRDYFMVSERWGNSPFTVTALMENGQPYATANVLRLGGPDLASPATPTSEAYTRYDWNTGFAPDGSHSDQAQTITVFSARKFFEGTNTQGGPIFGLRIDNNNEADFKIVGISDQTFADNAVNSQVIPEPSTILLTIAGTFWLLVSRKRPA